METDAFDAEHSPPPGQELTPLPGAAELWHKADWWVEQLIATFGDPAELAGPGLKNTVRLWLAGVEPLVKRLITAALLVKLPALAAVARTVRHRTQRPAFDPASPQTWRASRRFWSRIPAPAKPTAAPSPSASDFLTGGGGGGGRPHTRRSRWDPTWIREERSTAFGPVRRETGRTGAEPTAQQLRDGPARERVSPCTFYGHRPPVFVTPQQIAASLMQTAPTPCLALARRVEALRRALADPRAAARRLAFRLARSPFRNDLLQVISDPDPAPVRVRKREKRPAPGIDDALAAFRLRYAALLLAHPEFDTS